MAQAGFSPLEKQIFANEHKLSSKTNLLVEGIFYILDVNNTIIAWNSMISHYRSAYNDICCKCSV